MKLGKRNQRNDCEKKNNSDTEILFFRYHN